MNGLPPTGLRIALLSATALIAGVGAAVALAGAIPSFDGKIAKQVTVGTYKGEDIFNTTGTNQTLVRKGKSTSTRFFYWGAENENFGQEGPAVFKGAGDSRCFDVKYRVVESGEGGENVTAEVTSKAGYQVSPPPESIIFFEVEIRARSCADPGDERIVRMDASPSQTAFDRVRARFVVE